MPNSKIIRLNRSPKDLGSSPDALEVEMFDSPLPVQNSHDDYSNDELGLYVGVWDTTDMIEAPGPYACDEFMWLIEGTAEIKNCSTGAMEQVHAGEAFIIPKGYNCQWHQKGYLKKFYVISENPNETIPDKPSFEGIIIPTDKSKPNENLSLEPFLINSESTQHTINCYTDTTKKFFSGIWQTSAFESSLRAFPFYQFAYIEAGSITLIDENEKIHLFVEGDAFFIPKGVICTAKSTENVQLVYSILQTKS